MNKDKNTSPIILRAIFLLSVMFLLVAFSGFVSAIGTNSIYDEFDDSSINTSLWTTSLNGGTIAEDTSSITVESHGGESGGTAYATLTSLVFPNYTNVRNITLRVYLEASMADGGGCNARFDVLGNTIYSVSRDSAGSTTDDSVWTIIRNSTGINKFDVYNDGVFTTQITATNSQMIFYSYGQSPPASAGDRIGIAKTYYIYYFKEPVVLNYPINNLITNNQTLSCSANTGTGTLTNISLWINSTGTFSLNSTNIITGTQNTTIFNQNLISGNSYLWNCRACASDGTCAFAPANFTFTLDSTAPILYVPQPASLVTYGKNGGNLTLQFRATDTNLDSCWFSYDSTNYTVPCTTGVFSYYNFTLSNTKSLRLWANDTAGNLSSALISWNYSVFENSRSLNSTAYETGYESYLINVTANTSLTGINLLFNGTSLAMTNQGSGIWSYARDLPSSSVGNNTIQFNFTYGSQISSDTSYQFINTTTFGLCNSSLIIPYLNLTFKDESSLATINATIPTSTFLYYLGTGTQNKTLTYSSLVLNNSYAFCGLPSDKTYHIDPYVQYAYLPNYPQRIWNPSLTDYTNSTNNQLLYLNNDGIYVTFQIINSADQTISGVFVTATRTIEGVDAIVGQGTTGDDGSVTFYLSPDFITDFVFSKDGYTTYTTSFAPTQSGYTITLSGGGVVPTSYFKGINFNVIPTNESLINDTSYNFGFLLTSSFWDVSNYGFNLRLVNGTIISGGSTGTEGTQLSLNYNTNNQTKIYLDYFWTINGTSTNGTKLWIVYNTDQTQWSIAYFFTDLKAYMDSGIFGLDNFGRYLIIFLVMFIVVGIMSYKYGLTSPITVLLMIFLIIFFFDVVVGLIPTLTVANGHQVPYLLTFLSGLILIIFIFKEVYQ